MASGGANIPSLRDGPLSGTARGYFRYRRRSGNGHTVKPAPHDQSLAFEYGSALGCRGEPSDPARLEGYAAGRRGRAHRDCPYALGTQQRAWIDGWLTAAISLQAAPLLALAQWSALDLEVLDRGRKAGVRFKILALLLGTTPGAARTEACRRGLTARGRAPVTP